MPSGFQLDPKWHENLAHTRGTLNPIGNVVRSKTDQIARRARALAAREAAEAEARAERAKGHRYHASGKNPYQEAKAQAAALKINADAIHPIMLGASDGEDSTTGRVMDYYGGAAAIEIGGSDPVVKVGDDGTLIHHPHAILRRAVNE